MVGINPPRLEEIQVENEAMDEMLQFAHVLNSSYYMSPLLTAYDDHLYNIEKELKIAHLEIHHLNDFIRQLSTENEVL